MKSIFFLFFLWVPSAYANLCIGGPIWKIDPPKWTFKRQWDVGNFQRNHFGSTQYGVSYRTNIQIKNELGCYQPIIHLQTWDDITIRLNQRIKGNACYEQRVLEHEYKHQQYAVERRNQWAQYLREESVWFKNLQASKSILPLKIYEQDVDKILNIIIKSKGQEKDIELDSNNPARDVINKCGSL